MLLATVVALLEALVAAEIEAENPPEETISTGEAWVKLIVLTDITVSTEAANVATQALLPDAGLIRDNRVTRTLP